MTARPRTVLVVEDDEPLRMLCRITLELEGFTVREAASVEACRRAVADAPPAVVFLDVHLGETSSDALLDELEAEGIPVVLVSGSADVEQFRTRVTEVLGKPFEPSALVAAARRHVG